MIDEDLVNIQRLFLNVEYRQLAKELINNYTEQERIEIIEYLINACINNYYLCGVTMNEFIDITKQMQWWKESVDLKFIGCIYVMETPTYQDYYQSEWESRYEFQEYHLLIDYSSYLKHINLYYYKDEECYEDLIINKEDYHTIESMVQDFYREQITNYLK